MPYKPMKSNPEGLYSLTRMNIGSAHRLFDPNVPDTFTQVVFVNQQGEIVAHFKGKHAKIMANRFQSTFKEGQIADGKGYYSSRNDVSTA